MEELSTEYNSLRDLHLFTCIKYRVVFSFITIKYVHHLNVHQSLSMIQQEHKWEVIFIYHYCCIYYVYEYVVY